MKENLLKILDNLANVAGKYDKSITLKNKEFSIYEIAVYILAVIGVIFSFFPFCTTSIFDIKLSYFDLVEGKITICLIIATVVLTYLKIYTPMAITGGASFILVLVAILEKKTSYYSLINISFGGFLMLVISFLIAIMSISIFALNRK